MLIRNVGHLIQTPMILDQKGDEVYEGLVDAVITSLIALFNFKKKKIKIQIMIQYILLNQKCMVQKRLLLLAKLLIK